LQDLFPASSIAHWQQPVLPQPMGATERYDARLTMILVKLPAV
jgi:hypothetical protein